ncbi:hypothetical protein DL98DRAFT_598500 [Cadophora sp. DSE1049]|nr:hypothetical protein DL98DRAFT_598500 [Cadophora sp. DSE1049]
MRILLVGATGNLGLRLIPALLAHSHILTIYIRNAPKLRSLISPSLDSLVNAVVEGDATDTTSLTQALCDHDIEAIVSVAGNQVLPWREFQLPKIAKAVVDASIVVGKERGKPLRVWVTSGLGIMRYPGTRRLIQDFFPKAASAQHEATRTVVEANPLTDIEWSLLAISMMDAADPKQGVFQVLEGGPRQHSLLVKDTSPPGWRETWIGALPFIGPYLNVWYLALVEYRTVYEEVADFLAEELEDGGQEWLGKRVALKLDKKHV